MKIDDERLPDEVVTVERVYDAGNVSGILSFCSWVRKQPLCDGEQIAPTYCILAFKESSYPDTRKAAVNNGCDIFDKIDKWCFSITTIYILSIVFSNHPAKMHLKFHDDLDIHNIYNDIIKLLEDYVSKQKEYEDEYERYKVISVKSHNPTDKVKALEIMRRIEKFLPMIKDGSLLDGYKKKVAPYLEIYSQLRKGSRVFGMETCANIPKRVGTIILFIKTTQEYVDIEWECSYNMEKICPSCYSSMKKCGTIMMCDSCTYSHVIVKVPNLKVEDGKIKSESTYKASKNYRKELMHLCALIHGCKDGEIDDIRSYLYRAYIHKPTHNDIHTAIHQCGYNNYNDINYIYCEITKEELPPLDKYIDTFVSLFEPYYDTFQSIPDKEGKNITNLHFLTKLFCWQKGIEYKEEWFRGLSTLTENKHRRNAIKVCNILKEKDKDHNWSYPAEWDKPPKQEDN